MTNMSSTATTFSGYPVGNDNSSKVLPTPHATSTSGNMQQFQSKSVGGKRRNKKSKKYRKTNKRSKTAKKYYKSHKNRH